MDPALRIALASLNAQAQAYTQARKEAPIWCAIGMIIAAAAIVAAERLA